MSRPASLQELVHWLEAGAGGRAVRLGAFVLGAVVLSFVIGWKQFRGARSETTLLQADIGWQIGTGNGFTTRVKFPQTAAWLEARGEKYVGRAALPSLAEPPLYPVVIGGAVALLPTSWREKLFFPPPAPPDGSGFSGDYLLLGVNLGLLWLAAGLTYALARRLFDAKVALVALLGLLFSAAVWRETIAVNGTPLMMVLLLGLMHALTRAEAAGAAGGRATGWWALAGGVAGLMFLTDYPAGVAWLVVLGCAGFFPGRKKLAMTMAVLGFVVVITPWVWRNVALTGSPVGLAWQDLALRAGDPTAEPAVLRATLSAAAPDFSLNKLGNKGLSAVRAALGEKLWSGGGMFFTAFFVVGLVYRFRNDSVRRLRWAAGALLGGLIVAQAFLNSGAGERLPTAYGAPLFMVFGAGFFFVLVASDGWLGARAGWAAAGLLLLQAAPLGHDALEPRRAHFSYPPYYPGAFVALREALAKSGRGAAAWAADVPAGAAWYAGRTVWAQPRTLDEFYAVARVEPPVALVLTPHTLDRPFWSELTAEAPAANAPTASWAQVYSGLATGRFPLAFPLRQTERLASNFVVLLNPAPLPPP